ncbi:MAG: RNA polymerase sigma factor [Polyangiaceae bacterium]|nr:RNA polymerase sigma factor [Polyangiaceae bacterium]
MVAYVGGDEQAFRELFLRYAPRLLAMMRRQVRGADDAAELVQQTFLQLHRARLDFQPGRALRPWLLTIAFNLRRQHFRRLRRRPEAPLEEEPPASPPRDRVAAAQTRARLRAALAALPQGQREVITLHWFEELSFPEVAEVLGLGLSAVKVRAHRGYLALRELLADLPPPSA